MVRKCFLVVFFSSVVAGATATAQQADKTFKSTTPVVQDASWAKSWWMKRHREKLAEKSKMTRVDLIMIGDSIMHGWEGRGKKVWDHYYGKRNALNLGFSGDRTEHVIWRLQHGEVSDIAPKLAVIMIGTNNTGHRKDPPAEIAAGVRSILDELHQRLPSTKVLLLAIFPRGSTPTDPLRQINDQTNDLLKKFADGKRVIFLDINKVFLDDKGGLSKNIMPDLLHPNEKGYELWAKAIEPAVKKLMGEQ